MIDRLGHRTRVARPVLSIPFDDNDEISVIGPFLRCFANRPRHDGELGPSDVIGLPPEPARETD